MSRPTPPALTVRYEGSTRTFAAGNDVVVGRDLRADVRVAHPLISRAHLVLRFDHGRWVAIDNGSLNGMYANGRRVPSVDIADGQQINIGNPDGPGLTFEVGRHQGSAGTPLQTTSVPLAARPTHSYPPPPPSSRQRRVRIRQQPYRRPQQPIRRGRNRATRRVRRRDIRAARRPIRRAHLSPSRRGRRRCRAADLFARPGVGHPDGSDGRAAHERGQPRDEHAEDPAAGRPCPRPRRGRPRSAGRPTTTSSFPTCWRRATTRR